MIFFFGDLVTSSEGGGVLDGWGSTKGFSAAQLDLGFFGTLTSPGERVALFAALFFLVSESGELPRLELLFELVEGLFLFFPTVCQGFVPFPGLSL